MAPKCEPLCHFGDRLYFTTFPHPPPSPHILNNQPVDADNNPRVRARPRGGPSASPDDDATYYYFTIDDQLLYLSFFQDWGPLNLAMVYKACILIHELLEDKDLKSYRLVLYSSDDSRRKANAALLMALYVMIVQRRAPWEAFHPIAELEFMPFRDAGRGPSDFNLSIQDCLWGMWKAMQNGLCDMNEFSVEEYEYYEKVENGDWNWMTPNFIAFASPVDSAWIKNQKDAKQAAAGPPSPSRPGTASPGRSPASNHALQRKLPTPFCNCLDYFEKRGVKVVVRLNTELYDKQLFIDRGINHQELYFDDGTNPTDEIVRTFIDLSDSIVEDGGVIAVHVRHPFPLFRLLVAWRVRGNLICLYQCKAGLGRTGTLIGAYLIWKYGFTAAEAIAFMRIVRPGSVVGPQQQYMYLKQLEWAKWSAIDEMRRVQAAAAPVITPATPPAERDEEMEESGRMTPLPANGAPSVPLPPVTPSRHVLAATAKAHAIAPPGQPRKTPMAKRVAVDSDQEDEADEVEDTLPALGAAPPATRQRAKTIARPTGARGTASEQRPTRVLRSAVSTHQRKPPTAPTGTVAKTYAPPPNKIPRLAAGTTARNTVTRGMGAPSSRRVPQPPPSPTPSRLPTLAKRNNATRTLVEMAAGAKPKVSSDAWMTTGASAVVVPASKTTQRPGPRPVRRRRSSFSAADVVA
ncbi:phosphatases II [Paxillus ammoniavirescens]|nr:phosphatases II [Paxillus ammoniavirescens]